MSEMVNNGNSQSVVEHCMGWLWKINGPQGTKKMDQEWKGELTPKSDVDVISLRIPTFF